MSVIVIGRFKADPAAIKKLFAERAADFKAVSDEAKGVGALHHRFGAGDGEVLVLDEWNSADQFQKFFEGNTTIPQLLQAANVQGPPEFTFFEALDSPDQF